MKMKISHNSWWEWTESLNILLKSSQLALVGDSIMANKIGLEPPSLKVRASKEALKIFGSIKFLLQTAAPSYCFQPGVSDKHKTRSLEEIKSFKINVLFDKDLTLRRPMLTLTWSEFRASRDRVVEVWSRCLLQPVKQWGGSDIWRAGLFQKALQLSMNPMWFTKRSTSCPMW